MTSIYTTKLEKVLVISKTHSLEIEKVLTKNNFKVVKRDPDFIVCFGGDGTVLFSEKNFPQIPKLIVKGTNACRKYDYTLFNFQSVLSKIRSGRFRIQRELKLETEFKNDKKIALNEIQIHNQLPIYAIRFSLSVNEKEFDNLIGDGAIIATPFGSTGYYRATGGKQFKKGIGISFNNLHNKKIKSFVVSESSTVKLKVNRGPASLLADNNENFFELKENDVSVIRKSMSIANFIYVQ